MHRRFSRLSLSVGFAIATIVDMQHRRRQEPDGRTQKQGTPA